MYELHVYTMGSRDYAREIVKLIDPDRKYFGDRIISREDSGYIENRKQLKRIFPYDDRTALIIDDRSDVWEYSRNLIQVSPCIHISYDICTDLMTQSSSSSGRGTSMLGQG